VTDSKSSYREIIKATSLFGGVQIFNILISIIRSKFVAVFLGPLGMGIVGLLNSTTGFISGLTNFGLGISAVKDIAAANATGNQTRIATVVISFRRWVWITGTLGTLVTLALSPWLSEWTFGNRDYTVAFVWISITLLFSQLSTGQLAILQGVRKLQYLAKANVIGNALGLLITIPLYYYYRIDAIVPVIILSSIVSLLLSYYFANKIKIENIKVSRTRTIAEGKNMLILGFVMSLGNLMVLGTSYIVRIYISNHGGLADVGLYAAGFTIINTYVSLVFSAMLVDYYPRLSAVAHSNELCNQTINQQAEITLLILAPILVIFLIFISWIVILLYSRQFVAINDMINWAALAMFFKAASWSVGFILIAKGASKIFFWSELVGNIYMLALNIIGYHLWGLTGLGISFMIGFILYSIQVFLISKIKYDFDFVPAFYKIFIIQFILAIGSFVAVKFLSNPYPYFIGVVLIGISTWHSYKELDKRIGVKSLISNAIKKFR